MPDEPPWAGSLAAIDAVRFPTRVKPSIVPMLGIIMPSRTATPQVARPRLVRLPAAMRPPASSSSMAGNDRMMTSVFSPPAKRCFSAPTVLKLSSTSQPLACVNFGASSVTGPSTAPALITRILFMRRGRPFSFRAVPDVRIAHHVSADRRVGVAADQLAADVDVVGRRGIALGVHGADRGAVRCLLLFLGCGRGG